MALKVCVVFVALLQVTLAVHEQIRIGKNVKECVNNKTEQSGVILDAFDYSTSNRLEIARANLQKERNATGGSTIGSFIIKRLKSDSSDNAAYAGNKE